jgi:hypothetical protein
VFKRLPSNGLYYSGSPLRHAVLGRSARGGTIGQRPRGGQAYKEARPPSLVDAPEVLAAELSVDDSLKGYNSSPVKGDQIVEEDEYASSKRDSVEIAEFGCQTEILEEEKTIIISETHVTQRLPPPIHTSPATGDMGVQSDAEPIPVKRD